MRIVNGPSVNPYLIGIVRSLGIPFAVSRYNPVIGAKEYLESSEPPVIHVDVDEKRLPYFHIDAANTFAYNSLKTTNSEMLINLRILRTLREPKNITMVSLYLKTKPEITLVDIAVPFHYYPGPPAPFADTQISLEDQWKNSENNSRIQDVGVLSLESLYKEQERLLGLPRNRALIEERMGYIQYVLAPEYIRRENEK